MGSKKLTITFIVLTLAAALLAWGCATANPPTAEISRAEVAVERAREAGAQTHAPLDLNVAEEKLREARDLAGDERMVEASDLAVEAELDARLAEEKTRAERAEEDTRQLQKSVAELRRQLERR